MSRVSKEQKLIAAIYARYSSLAQRDVSIEQQIEECKEYATANNMEVVAIYADRAITGKTDKRPDFQKMIRHAEKGHFQVIIAYKSNRIARNMLQALSYEDRLEKHGVRVVYAKEEFGDTAAGRFALRTMMNVNQFYSENLAEDVKRGLLDNASNCMITNGALPLGYKKGEDGRWALDEKNAAIVREIFSRVACRESFTDIAADLNARGIKTSRGNYFNKGSFHRMLTNERYTGVYIYDSIRIEGGIPQIIDKELFYTVQEVLKTKNNPQGRHRENGDYLLTGKLYCGQCKSPMIGLSGTGKLGKLHHYYICQKKRTEHTCDKAAVRRDWIEMKITEAIKNYIMQDDIIEWIADTSIKFGQSQKKKAKIAALEDRLAANKTATKNILAAIEQGIITATTKERLLELETEQSKLVARIAMERSEMLDVNRDQIIFWIKQFREGDIFSKEYQKNAIDKFLVRAYLYDKYFKAVFSFTGKKNTAIIYFDETTIEHIGEESPPECSYKINYDVPKQKAIPCVWLFVLIIIPENRTRARRCQWQMKAGEAA